MVPVAQTAEHQNSISLIHTLAVARYGRSTRVIIGSGGRRFESFQGPVKLFQAPIG